MDVEVAKPTTEERRLLTKWMPKCSCGNIISRARAEAGVTCCPACEYQRPDAEVVLQQIAALDLADGCPVTDIVRKWEADLANHLTYLQQRRANHARRPATDPTRA